VPGQIKGCYVTYNVEFYYVDRHNVEIQNVGITNTLAYVPYPNLPLSFVYA
jgi:hypothetical protein